MKEFILTEKDIEVANTLKAKSVKVLIKFMKPVFYNFDRNTGLELPETVKKNIREGIAITDIKKFSKYHLNIGIVLSVGSKIAMEESFEVGDILLLRSCPGITDHIMFNEEDYYAIDNAMILASIKNSNYVKK